MGRRPRPTPEYAVEPTTEAADTHAYESEVEHNVGAAASGPEYAVPADEDAGGYEVEATGHGRDTA